MMWRRGAGYKGVMTVGDGKGKGRNAAAGVSPTVSSGRLYAWTHFPSTVSSGGGW
jgi:hypothetical protein